jgi:hypothetical protein
LPDCERAHEESNSIERGAKLPKIAAAARMTPIPEWMKSFAIFLPR